MTRTSSLVCVFGWGFIALSCMQAKVLSAAPAARASVTQTAGVDDTRMGTYRALAQLCLRAFEKGNKPRAAELARILERSWDAAEGGGGKLSLIKTDKKRFEQIDQALDLFIKPIIHYENTPDPDSVRAAYNNFLEKLAEAE